MSTFTTKDGTQFKDVSYRRIEFPFTSILRGPHDGSAGLVSTGAAFQPVACTGCAVTAFGADSGHSELHLHAVID